MEGRCSGRERRRIYFSELGTRLSYQLPQISVRCYWAVLLRAGLHRRRKRFLGGHPNHTLHGGTSCRGLRLRLGHPCPAFLTPFDDGIYAMCQGAISGSGPATPLNPRREERHRLDGINRLIRADMNNQAVNGWHVRTTGTIGPGGHLEIPLGEGGTISVIIRKNRPLEQWI